MIVRERKRKEGKGREGKGEKGKGHRIFRTSLPPFSPHGIGQSESQTILDSSGGE